MKHFLQPRFAQPAWHLSDFEVAQLCTVRWQFLMRSESLGKVRHRRVRPSVAFECLRSEGLQLPTWSPPICFLTSMRLRWSNPSLPVVVRSVVLVACRDYSAYAAPSNGHGNVCNLSKHSRKLYNVRPVTTRRT